MEPIDREDSSTYINKPQDQPEVPQPVQRAEPPKQKKGRGAAILAFLLFLAIVAVAALGWLWYQQSGRVGDLESDLSSARNNIARLESTAKAEAAIDDSDVTLDTDSTSSDAIIEAALAYSKAKIANKGIPAHATSLTGTVAKKTTEFARVEVQAASDGPGMQVIFFKYVDKEWVLIGDGDGDLTKLQTNFGLPKDF